MIPEPALFTLWYDFTKWLLGKTEKFPRSIRYSLSNRIDNLALDIMGWISEARYSRDKRQALKKIDIGMEKLRVLLRICHDLAHLDHKGYEYAARQINEAGKMVGGWRKQQDRQL